MPSGFFHRNAECCYVDCLYAECRGDWNNSTFQQYLDLDEEMLARFEESVRSGVCLDSQDSRTGLIKVEDIKEEIVEFEVCKFPDL